MKGNLNYFLINKEDDYQSGLLEHMDISGAGIFCTAPEQERGIFLSRAMDSMEREMEWHRLTVRGAEKIHAPFRLSVYASDREPDAARTAEREGGLAAIVKDMEGCRQMSAINASDLLLHGVKGRFLWISLEVYGAGGKKELFHDFKIYFPARSWIAYLPEIYQQKDRASKFLERYLGIFQTLHEDLNLRIDTMADCFDTALADRAMLEWLAGWLDMDKVSLWSVEQLRSLLGKAVFLFKNRGTRKGITQLVEIYTGEAPLIVESFQLPQYASAVRHYRQLSQMYPQDGGAFSILVREEVFAGGRTREGLREVLEMTRPAGSECHLIVLNQYLFLGGYSYLGINTTLRRYQKAVLSGSAGYSLAAL